MSARILGYCCLFLLSAVTGFLLTTTLFGGTASADGGTRSPPREAPFPRVDALDPPEPLRYRVEWTDTGIVFHHPDERGAVPGELFIPVDQPVVLEFHSTEEREFAIPAFRVHRIVPANKFASLWFQATVPGSYEILHRRSTAESYELAGYARVGRW